MGFKSSCTARFKKRKEASSDRTVLVNNSPSQSEEALRTNKRYGNNRIISSHYTWWNFLLMNLFEQFHVIANLFFLLISILYFFGETPINPLTTIAPLVAVIGISIVKDAIDDFKRHKTDREFNQNVLLVLTHDPVENTSRWEPRESQNIMCGDILICRKDNSFPCDMLLLASSNSNGKVFITTDNLDGETSMKTTNALPFTHTVLSPTVQQIEDEKYQNVNIKLSRLTLLYQNPSEDLKAFEGHLNYENKSIPLAFNNLVLRGTNLRNTAFVLGVAVYTGEDTKLSLNSKPGYRKFSSSSSKFNAILLVFIVIMFAITLLETILHFVWKSKPYGTPWYFFTPPASDWRRVQQYLTTLFIMNYLIPISIMVTMELQQLLMALYISQDIEFYDPESNEKAQVNATTLADELGQIEFLFSDKTGTLTKNDMVFKSYSLADDPHVYTLEDGSLFMVQDDSKATSTKEMDKKTSPNLLPVNNMEYLSSSEDDDIDDCINSSSGSHRPWLKQRVFKLSKTAKQFWLNIALCHSIETKIEVDEVTEKEVVVYNATSPDEKALVDAAAAVGYTYLGVDDADGQTHLVLHKPGLLDRSKIEKVKTRRFFVDAVLEFNSVRKSMSVMVRDEKDNCFVYTKGAEVAMLDPRRCGKTPSDVKDDIIHKVTEFALSGLRTLVFSVRYLDLSAYQILLKQLHNAQCKIGPERVRDMDDAFAKIECDMELLGVSGVEDKLQPGVRHCLQSLISAGIQVWVLTGDKEETAVQVSQATGHFPPGTTLIRLTNGQNVEDVGRSIYVQQEGMKARLEVKRTWMRFKNFFRKTSGSHVYEKETLSDSESASSRWSVDFGAASRKHRKPPSRSIFHRAVHCFRSAVADGLRRHRRKNPGGANEPVGLVIDGTTLRFAITPVLRDQFLRLCMNVTTVLCCRVTPLQKAAVVRLVSHGLKGVGGGGPPVTGAVGDGGNDVAMLQEASVGIGIFGNEGRQAVRASDYSVPLFKHLRRLILVHGHWNYHRISMTANIFYFKNVAFVAIQVYQMFYDGLSGQSLFDSMLFTLYNLTFTSYAPFVFGIFEQHVPSEDLIRRPYLYRLMSQSANLRCWYILLWVIDGWWHGTVIYFVGYYFLAGGLSYADATFVQPGASYTAVDFNMFGNACYIYLVVTSTMRIILMSRYLNLFIIAGIPIVGVANLVIMFIYQTVGGTSTYVYMNYTYLACCPAFWLGLLVVLTLTLLPDILWRIGSDAWWDYQLALSGVKRIREKRNRKAWRKFITRGASRA